MKFGHRVYLDIIKLLSEEFLKFRFFSNLWYPKIAKIIEKSPKVANIGQKMKFQKFLRQKVLFDLDTPPVQISSF